MYEKKLVFDKICFFVVEFFTKIIIIAFKRQIILTLYMLFVNI